MSSESYKNFVEKVKNDAVFQQELREAGGESKISVEKVVAFAASKGYAFKVEDVNSELSEAQLEAVAGGFSPVDGFRLQPPDGNLPPDGLKRF